MIVINIYILLPAFLGFIAFVIYVLKNPEIIDKWSHLFYKYIYWRKDVKEKRIISSNLDYKITHVAKKINKEADGIIPFGIRIKWKNPEEVTAYVQNNDVVVVLKKGEDSDKNVIEACCAYVPKALLPKSRNIISPKLLKSIDQYVIKKILSDGNYDSAYNFFIRNIFTEVVESDEELKEYIDDIGNLDSIGFFTRVLLEEFRRLGLQLFGTNEEQNFRNETIKFLNFLNNFYHRKAGDRTELDFQGEKIKVSIGLVAKRSTLDKFGLSNHIKKINEKYRKGMQRIFIFSYAHLFEQEDDHSGNGHRNEFYALSQLEKECRSLNFIRLIKKQKYISKDNQGRTRTAKYILYEIVQ